MHNVAPGESEAGSGCAQRLAPAPLRFSITFLRRLFSALLPRSHSGFSSPEEEAALEGACSFLVLLPPPLPPPFAAQLPLPISPRADVDLQAGDAGRRRPPGLHRRRRWVPQRLPGRASRVVFRGEKPGILGLCEQQRVLCPGPAFPWGKVRCGQSRVGSHCPLLPPGGRILLSCLQHPSTQIFCCLSPFPARPGRAIIAAVGVLSPHKRGLG